MFVRSFPSDQEMLFPMATAHILYFWMKNPLIPRDLLFVTERGRIACISAMAKPRSLDLITCRHPPRRYWRSPVARRSGAESRSAIALVHAVFHR
jgi:uncharacterized membrane protein (UPF0127 family)